jgi:hypothetical protein
MRITAGTFSAAPAGFLGRMRTSLQSAVNHCRIPDVYKEAVMNNNGTEPEYVVTSLLILCDALYCHGSCRIALTLAMTPISLWEDHGTTEIELIARHSTHLELDMGKCKMLWPNRLHPLVGRIKTITGRDLRHHDTLAELKQRSSVTVPHAYDISAMFKCDCWHNDLHRELRAYCQEAVSTAPNSPQTLRAWWATRAVWASHGTSSTKIRDDKQLNTCLTDKRITMTKAMALGRLPNNYMLQALASKPRMVCRSATKNEPGKKRRPLRACDDLAYCIAAFASNNMEKYLSIQGSVMRQTPDDVRRTDTTLKACAATKDNMIMCLDYSDFNNTHTTRSRTLLNLALAEAYAKAGMFEQAKAAIWIARAHMNHWLDGQLCAQGLSSGERDTARDNTMLHNIYSKLAAKAAGAVNARWKRPQFTQMCGDDEIAAGFRWTDAMAYLQEHANQGHAINIRKIMVSDGCAEFLQYNMHAREYALPRQPLPPAINNFVSGSWYKSSNYSVYDYPQQVAEAAASCIRRGASDTTMKMLCAATCKWLCGGNPWRDALMATNLFGATCERPARITVAKADNPGRDATWPAAGHYVAEIGTRMAFTADEKAVIHAYALSNIISSIDADLRTEEQQYATVDRPLTRLEIPLPPTKTELQCLARAWATVNQGPRMDEPTWMAVQLGLPLPLVTRLGMATIMISAKNAQRAKINTQTPIGQQRITPTQMAMLPGALATYFRVADRK